MINSKLKSIAKIKKETGESISDIRVLFEVMNDDVDDTLEIIKRFYSQGHTNIKQTLKSKYSLGPPLTLQKIQDTEDKIGYKLPGFYKDMLLNQNSIEIDDGCFPVNQSNSWSNDHICITEIYGINTYNGLSLEELNSKNRFKEWGYPNIGLVIGDTPASGHAIIMLDYTSLNKNNEPSVVFVDTPRRHHNSRTIKLTESLSQFMQGLVSEENFDNYDD